MQSYKIISGKENINKNIVKKAVFPYKLPKSVTLLSPKAILLVFCKKRVATLLQPSLHHCHRRNFHTPRRNIFSRPRILKTPRDFNQNALTFEAKRLGVFLRSMKCNE